MDSREARLAKLRDTKLYVVTDARREQGDLPEFLDAILGAGVGIVQLREKQADAAELLSWGATFRAACDRHDALFIVDDRPDVALALGADGVHVGQQDVPASICRRILGSEAIIGLTCNSPEDHANALPEADYLTAGPIFATPTKPGRTPVGLDLVRSAAEHVSRPWFAIGGIDSTNIADVRAAGATQIAVVRAVTDATDPAKAVAELLEV